MKLIVMHIILTINIRRAMAFATLRGLYYKSNLITQT